MFSGIHSGMAMTYSRITWLSPLESSGGVASLIQIVFLVPDPCSWTLFSIPKLNCPHHGEACICPPHIPAVFHPCSFIVVFFLIVNFESQYSLMTGNTGPQLPFVQGQIVNIFRLGSRSGLCLNCSVLLWKWKQSQKNVDKGVWLCSNKNLSYGHCLSCNFKYQELFFLFFNHLQM